MSSDELTRAIAATLGCEESSFYGVGVCVAHGPGWPCRKAEHVAAALAPLIEARVRDARADAWDEGLIVGVPDDQGPGMLLLLGGTNPYRVEEARRA